MSASVIKLSDSTQRLIWMLVALCLALVPHASNVPFWITLLVTGAAVWRLAIEHKGWKLPPRFLRILIAFAALFGVAASYRTLNGLEAGTALLAMMAGVKLLETRDLRDYTILVFIAYFLLFAAFLYDQGLLQLPYLLIATWLVTAMLLRLHATAQPMPAVQALKTTGTMLVQALPIAVLLFLFFPRLPGQFWALPTRGGATTGLSDEMNPGDVSELSLSSAVAFRVRFDGPLPPSPQRYWRGPVLHEFDGRTWRRTPGVFFPMQEVQPAGTRYDYRITLEPSNQRWLLALDLPTGWPERQVFRTADFQLLTSAPISTTTSFDLRSHVAYSTSSGLPRTTRRADLSLPGERNPRARALALEMRARHDSDAAFIEAMLSKFREEEYFYTLEPPRLEADSVDDFLFNTRRGFCEHFASAFTMLMRAAGIPARVVTGYQGGEFNPMGGYVIVRQSDAHAWSEVWLEDRGWIRVDPTAAVAPERIERGLDAAVGAEEPVPGRLISQSELLSRLRFAWDAVNTFWNDRIVEFDADDQRSVLSWMGVDDADWRWLGVALAITVGAFLVALAFYLAWQFRPQHRDPAAQLYAVLCRKLARRQLPRQPHEGPADYFARAMAARPDLNGPLRELRSLYLGLRYEPSPVPQQLSRMRYLVNRLEP